MGAAGGTGLSEVQLHVHLSGPQTTRPFLLLLPFSIILRSWDVDRVLQQQAEAWLQLTESADSAEIHGKTKQLIKLTLKPWWRE